MENTQKTPYNSEDILKITFCIIIFAFTVAGLIYGFVHDRSQNKKYGTAKYELVITDKYDDLGSTWHLIGGRATEQEYHIVYRYRLTNRPELEGNMEWNERETSVSGSMYHKLHIGQTLYNNNPFLPY